MECLEGMPVYTASRCIRQVSNSIGSDRKEELEMTATLTLPDEDQRRYDMHDGRGYALPATLQDAHAVPIDRDV